MPTTVLAVDDSVTMRKVLEITFGSDDFNTVLAADTQQAMQLLASARPAIAVIDHALGEASGYDLCRQIKSAAPQTRVIILSSKQHPFDRARGSSSGADDFMDKPFDTEKMLEKVRQVMAQAPKAAAGAPPPKPAAAVHAPAPVPASATSQRPRPQTLAYGTPGPGQSLSAQPPAPVAARPAAAPAPQTPPAAPAAQRPAPAVAKPVAAPAPARPAPAAPAAPTPAPIATAAAAATSGNGQLAGKLQSLGLTPDQVQAVLALSREVVEQVVWEVVPVLAETIIKEEIRRLTTD